MSDDVPQEFFDLADRFVDVANTLVPQHGIARVSSAFMFAASRFNAHCGRELDAQVDERRDAFIAYMVEQYRAMLVDNLDRLGIRRAEKPM